MAGRGNERLVSLYGLYIKNIRACVEFLDEHKERDKDKWDCDATFWPFLVIELTREEFGILGIDDLDSFVTAILDYQSGEREWDDRRPGWARDLASSVLAIKDTKGYRHMDKVGIDPPSKVEYLRWSKGIDKVAIALAALQDMCLQEPEVFEGIRSYSDVRKRFAKCDAGSLISASDNWLLDVCERLAVARKLKPPSKMAIAAYRLRFSFGRKQEEIAGQLSTGFKRRVSQGEVSRWLKSVEAFMQAGGILPELKPYREVGKPISGSDFIELGPRVNGEEGLVKRQRKKRDDD